MNKTRRAVEKRADEAKAKGANSLDSSSVAQADGDEKDGSDLEGRAATQYPLVPGQQQAAPTPAAPAVAVSGALKSAASAAASPAVKVDEGKSVGAVTPSIDGYFTGVSSYYLHTLNEGDRLQVLDAIKGAGFKVVRIFISSVYAGNKVRSRHRAPPLMYSRADCSSTQPRAGLEQRRRQRP